MDSFDSSSSSAQLLDDCLHGRYDTDAFMVEDLDAPTSGLGTSTSGGPALSAPPRATQSAGTFSGPDGSRQQAYDSGDGGARGSVRENMDGSKSEARSAANQISQLWRATTATNSAEFGHSSSAPGPGFSAQLAALTSQLQAHQAGAAAAASATAEGADLAHAVNIAAQQPLTPATAAGSAHSSGGHGRLQSPPNQVAVQASASTTSRLSMEQYQQLLNAGVDPSLIIAALAAQAPAPDPAPAPTQTPANRNAADALALDAAEGLWQRAAASGADDQTLLALAASLGLIASDTAGNVVLTRELQQNTATAASAAQPMLLGGGLAAALSRASGVGGPLLPGLASGSGAPAALARLNPAVLASLMNPYDVLRVPSGMHNSGGGGGSGSHATGSGAPKSLSSPGPGPSKQHTLYKTELCRGWLEAGTCRYGSKCQFAHGPEELRPVPRHPKYKTEVCRSFTATGMCAYGARCRFIHGSISAPNAVFGVDLPPSGRSSLTMPANRMSEGMDGLEGVFTLDDPSPNAGLFADLGRSSLSMSPRSRIMLALGGGPVSLRGAASGPSAGASRDTSATSFARLAVYSGAAGRASLENLLGGAPLPQPGRNSMGDTQRSSMDSRGRASLESTQSAQDPWQVRELMMMDAAAAAQQLPSPPKGGAGISRGGGGGGGAIATDTLYGLTTAQRFMPGIPEGSALPVASGSGGVADWARAQQQQQQQQHNRMSLDAVAAQHGVTRAVAGAAAQLAQQMQAFTFSQAQQRSLATAAAQQQQQRMSMDAPAAARQQQPSGLWFPASGSGGGAPPRMSVESEAASASNTLLLSAAYNSGLYASSAGQGGSLHGPSSGLEQSMLPRGGGSNLGLSAAERSSDM